MFSLFIQKKQITQSKSKYNICAVIVNANTIIENMTIVYSVTLYDATTIEYIVHVHLVIVNIYFHIKLDTNIFKTTRCEQ